VTCLDRLDPSHLFPVLRSAALEELSRTRGTWTARTDSRAWTPEHSLDETGAGLDSLELLGLAQRVNEQFGLHERGVEDYLLARRRFCDWGELILDTWRGVPTPKVVFRSSGSTGTRKSVPHALSALEEECLAFLEILPPAESVAAFVPSHHIYGFLFAFLMPVLDGVPLVDRTASPLALNVDAPTRIVSFPNHWKMIAEGPALEKLSSAHGVSSTGPLETTTAERIRGAGMELFEVYGSTESAGVGYRNRTGSPSRLLHYWRRDPVDGQRIYRGTGEGKYVVQLLDDIEWVTDRDFVVGGRLDDVVQVGGVNVSLEAVSTALAEHPAVKECAVRRMSPEEGDRLKAFVVPEAAVKSPEEETILRRGLFTWAAERLSVAEQPRAFSFGEALPRNDLGKVLDWSLRIPNPEETER
jgi:long-chain acyl-CoA synthetase